MVELIFNTRLKNFVPLSILRQISACSTIDEVAQLNTGLEDNKSSLAKLKAEDFASLKAMPLLNRGRLSVQSVNSGAWVAINKLAEIGDWGDVPGSKKSGKPGTAKTARQTKTVKKPAKRKNASDDKSATPLQAGEDNNQDRLDDEPRRSKRLKS
jgi:hypothetical protein